MLGKFWTLHELLTLQPDPQDVGDFRTGAGETLEQHAVFQEYETLLGSHLDRFVADEGFGSPEECFEQVKQGAESNKVREAAALAELQAKLAADMDAAKQAAAAEEGGAPGGPAQQHVTAGPGMVAPLPVPLESLLLQVANLGEYTTFSIMIRAKATQMRLEKETKNALAKGPAPTPAERLAEGASSVEVFVELRERLCDLTPNRSDIRDHVSKMLDAEGFKRIVEEAEGWRGTASEQLRFSCFHIDYLSSPAHQKEVFEWYSATGPVVEADMVAKEYVETYLGFIDRCITRIQKDLAAAFEARQQHVGP